MKSHLLNGTLKDIVYGICGGLVGTYAMDKVTTFLYNRESEEAKKEEARLMKEPAYNLLARKIAARKNIRLSPYEARKAGSAIHWLYGLLWGALYGAAQNRVSALSKAGGIPFGVMVFLIGDEAMNTVLGLAPPPQQFPLAVHLRGLAGHVVYSVTATAVQRGLKRVI